MPASPDQNDDSKLVVCKLGGSLLSLPGLAERIESVLEEQGRSRSLLVVGGGAAADIVRRWSRQFCLSEETAHQLALEAMAFNAALVVRLLPQSVLVFDDSEIEPAWREGLIPIVHPPRVLADLEARSNLPLPHTWDAASDTIAGWIAAMMDAQKLVLMKSTDRPGRFWREAANDGAVDAHFPVVAQHVRSIEWINLRAGSGDR
ncbi:MAG: hypothetical protein DWQ34_00840 [Planctomycetota bacterium]|nr:MAG: hypothetical protein DWQ29_19070 [Planctomycetota bacterium]REJ97916.1 MAG: hypothetical protein DWQ34_00840 [Planctomycetota bacterium]REK25613.1 MAG: hypothetical protein DWQ41_11810 [Planctomycetota bacterium]REK31676.1 MAG: hypothetical protein DWQ45_18875 [Planctomycetota bacterium]